MSRIMAGKVALTLDRARLADIVTAAADALQPVAAGKGVRLVIDVQRAWNVWVSCDAARLQQVVTNLLGNGIKFTPAGGEVELLLTARADGAQLVVRDTGQGIDPEFLPAVFERFRQADGSITRRHGGLGLGLSIAKQIVDMHGGTIRAHSDGPGLGAVFTVTLPVVDGSVARDSAPEEEGWTPVPLTDLRVLVVDDEADARELFRRLLAEHGCEVTCVSSAEEALAVLSARPCDVLLTDIGMPGMDGYELLRRVRTGSEPHVRAIAVTAFARPEDRDRALAAGFEAHLPKPISPAHLLKAVARPVTHPPPRPTGALPRRH